MTRDPIRAAVLADRRRTARNLERQMLRDGDDYVGSMGARVVVALLKVVWREADRKARKRGAER